MNTRTYAFNVYINVACFKLFRVIKLSFSLTTKP